MDVIERNNHGKKPFLVFESYIQRKHSTMKNKAKTYSCTREKTCKQNGVLNDKDFKLNIEAVKFAIRETSKSNTNAS